MLRISISVSLLAATLSLKAQYKSFEIYEGDTINRVDIDNMKQGNWAFFGYMKNLDQFRNMQIVEIGSFKNNRRNGKWTRYYPNDSIYYSVQFINNRPNGEYIFFYQNGSTKETGIFKNNRTIEHVKFDVHGDTLVHANLGDSLNRLSYMDSIFRTNENPHYSIKAPRIINDSGIDFDWMKVQGSQTIYRSDKQIWKKGQFADGELINGHWYRYDANGILQKIEVYKDGKYVDDAPIEN